MEEDKIINPPEPTVEPEVVESGKIDNVVLDPVTVNEDDEPLEVLTFKQKWKMNRKLRAKRIIIALIVLGGIVAGMHFIFLHGLGINIFADAFGGGSSAQNTDLGEVGVALMFTFIGLYVLQALTLNFIPGTTTVFISGLAWILFQENFLHAYMVALCAILITAFILYFYGRYVGRGVLYWMFGREKLDKRLDWFARNGAKGVPWLFLIPFFPTDLVVVTCGASKMKFWQFVPMVMVFKPIEVALLLSYPFLITSGFVQSLRPHEIVIAINLILINILLLIVYHRTLLKIFNKFTEPFTGRKAYKEGLEQARLAAVATQKGYEAHDLIILNKNIGCPECNPNPIAEGQVSIDDVIAGEVKIPVQSDLVEKPEEKTGEIPINIQEQSKPQKRASIQVKNTTKGEPKKSTTGAKKSSTTVTKKPVSKKKV